MCTAEMMKAGLIPYVWDINVQPLPHMTREYVPYLICGRGVKPGVDLGTKLCFGTIAHTVCEYLGVDASTLDGQSVWEKIRK